MLLRTVLLLSRVRLKNNGRIFWTVFNIHETFQDDLLASSSLTIRHAILKRRGIRASYILLKSASLPPFTGCEAELCELSLRSKNNRISRWLQICAQVFLCLRQGCYSFFQVVPCGVSTRIMPLPFSRLRISSARA